MAFSTTLLAWSLLEFRNAYLASYQIPHLMNALKWSTDYFLKCHVSKFEFYGQVSSLQTYCSLHCFRSIVHKFDTYAIDN